MDLAKKQRLPAYTALTD